MRTPRTMAIALAASWVWAGCPTDDPVDDDDTTIAQPPDDDGDGYPADEDCDDDDPTSYPGAEELCDGIDNDCDGLVDDDLADADADGFADCVDPTPEGFDGADGRETPRSVQLHLHGSLSEMDGTMLYHTAAAEAAEVDVLWWSDHDHMTMMCTRGGGYDFDGESFSEMIERVGIPFLHGIEEESVTLPAVGSVLRPGGPSGAGFFWRIHGVSAAADPDWQHARYAYYTLGNISYQRLPLLADARVELAVQTHQPLHEDWYLTITAQLSGNLAGTSNHITYYVGMDELLPDDTADHLYRPLSVPWEELWTSLELPLSADAEAFAERDDQSLMQLSFALWLRGGAEATVDLDDIAFRWEREGDALRHYQRQVLDERYADGDVVHFVGQEITLVEDENHINEIGEHDVPFIDYPTTSVVSLRDAVDHVHAAGALAQCNHPFGLNFAVQYEGADAELLTDLLVEQWLAEETYGCDLVEVGYLARVVDLDHQLLFWDRLLAEGYRLTGVGSSDHHWPSDWLTFVNPFVTWVFVDVPTRASMAAELGAGRAFFGDPGPFVGRHALLDVWSEHGAVMGEELITALDVPVRVQTGDVDPGWTLRLVVDGTVFESRTLVGDETDSRFDVPRGEVRTIRAELLDLDGERILVSNPIYLGMPAS